MNLYLLAGGSGTRLGGVDKASLRIGSSSIVELILDQARAVFDEIVLVRRAATSREGLRSIVDKNHSEPAPIFGLRSAMVDSAEEKLFVLAADLPFVSTKLLAHVRDRGLSSNLPLIVPHLHGIAQMLCAVYSASLLPRVEQRILSKRYALKDLCAPQETLLLSESELAFIDEREFINVNTQEDLDLARRII